MTKIAAFATPSSISKNFSTESAQKSSEPKQPSLFGRIKFGRIKAFVNSSKFPETLLKAGSALMVTGAVLTGIAAYTGGISVAPGVILLATGGLLYGAGLVVSCIQKYAK